MTQKTNNYELLFCTYVILDTLPKAWLYTLLFLVGTLSIQQMLSSHLNLTLLLCLSPALSTDSGYFTLTLSITFIIILSSSESWSLSFSIWDVPMIFSFAKMLKIPLTSKSIHLHLENSLSFVIVLSSVNNWKV